MHIDFAFLADSATARPDGRIDAEAIGSFTVTSDRFPTTIQRFAVVTRVAFAPEDGETPGHLRVRIVAPDGTTVAEQSSVVEAPPVYVTETAARTRTRIVNFFNVPITEPGMYRCRLSLDGQEYIGIHFDAVCTPVAV